MSTNHPLPQAYLFSNVGVFDSNNGVDFVTGVDDLGIIQTAYANSFGTVTVISPNSVFLGNTTWFVTITAPSPAQVAGGYVLLANGGWGPGGGGGAGAAGGPNGAIQYSNGGVLAGNGSFTYVAGVLTIGTGTLNSTAWSGSANSSAFIGTLPSANVVSNAQLIANLANYTTTIGLPAVIAVNAANNSLYLGGVPAASYLTSISATYVQNSDSRVLSGNLQFSGANVTFGNSTVYSVANATFFSQTSNNSLYLGGVLAVSYVLNTDSRVLSGNLQFSGANVTFGNSTVYSSVNSTFFSQTANNSLYLGGALAAAYVLNTDSRVLSGNIQHSGANVTFGNSTVWSSVNSTFFSQTANNSLYLGGFAANQYTFSNTITAVNTCYFAVYNGGTQTGIPATTFTLVTFPNVASDSFGSWVSANNAYKPQVAGNYNLSAGVYFQGNSSGTTTIALYKNGAEYLRGTQIANAQSNYLSTISATVPMNGSTDFVQVFAFTTPVSGTATLGASGNTLNWFNGHLLAGSTVGPAVRYDTTQSLTTAQANTARTNINASSRLRTRTVLTSGSGTYTTPANCVSILVRIVGGGGGGGGGGSGGGGGGGGSGTTFGTMSAGGGNNGSGGGNAYASGGNSSGGDINLTGGYSMASFGAGGASSVIQGSSGGVTVFGGNGTGGWPGGNGSNGQAGTGAGGGGGGCSTAGLGGSGGAAGGYCEKLFSSPSATYTYAVGAGGTPGSPASGGSSGGSGGSGIIIIDEYY